jgi:glycosyltransferase involved in cell wall biosynthesis
MDLSNPTLAVTYKDDGNQDGICSQLLRIYGIYAISRFLGVPYVHSPIAHLGYHGLAALENNSPLPNLLADVNRVFHIPSDIELPDKRVTVIHDMIDADVESIERIKNAGINDQRVHLIRILYAFPVTDSNPELYRCLETICPFPYRRSEVFRLAIHVRRGELFAVSSDWMLPNSYYVSCVLRFQDVLRKLNIPFVCELYTEVPSKTFEVTPQHHGINGRIAETVIFDPAMNHLEDFEGIPNLERFINFDPIESLRRMATADALIISHSSFSYLPAIFNPNCIVIYNPYWRGRMKDWLISDDNGVFAESGLVERLKGWKQAADRDSAAALPRAIDVPPRDLHTEIERLQQPFRRQSAAIRSVVAVECHRTLGMNEEAALLRLVAGEDSVRPTIRVEPIGPAGYTLDRLARQACGISGSSPGDDLLLVPVDVLNEKITPPADEFSFRAVAAIFPGPSGRPGDGHNWKVRRSLFDRGLVCIGSVDFVAGHALCFLASDAVRSFNQLDVESRGHVTMSTLTEGVGFGNQLWRYACVKLYALRHGLTPALPAWQGNQLFSLEDKSCAAFAFPKIAYPGFADNDRELWDLDDPPINIDLEGYFQEIPECWQKHRELLRRMFQLSPAHVRAIDAWRDAVTDGGRRTLVAISVRRGDYYKFQSESWPWFRIVPNEWYLDWLRTIWPTLSDPVLFVTSDEPDKILPVFQEFEPVPATFGSIGQGLPQHVRDFEVLRRADYLAICNSSFPRFAAILAPSTQKCFLPSFQTQSFLPYEPWMDPAFWPRFSHTWSRVNLGGKEEQPAPATNTETPTHFFEVSDLLLSLRQQTKLSDIQRIQWEILSNVLDILRPQPVCFAVLNKEGGLGTIEPKALLSVIARMRTDATSRAEIESEVRALLNRAVPCTIRSRDVFLTIGAFWNVSGMGTSLQNVKNSGAIIGVFIHDIIPIAAPEFFESPSSRLFVKGVAEALSFADFILTASEYSKVSLTRHMGSPLDSFPVHVVPLGHQFSLPAPAEFKISAAVAGILETDYVFCTGSLDVRKNPTYLFNIWKMMLRSGRPNIPHLVFAGREGWLVEDFLHQLKACNYLDGRILVVNDATDAELDSLYRNCLLTAFPSFVEGWGLPVGESLARGKICICSGEGGIPEVGGELADYVDPYNVREGVQRFLRYLDDPELRRSRELEIAGRFRARSWRQAADDLLSSTQMLARQARPFEGVTAVMLPPGRYVPISSEGPAILTEKMNGRRKLDGGLSAELMCVSGWYPPEISGIRASRPTAIVRFRSNVPVGTRINLVLRLAAHGRAFRIRIYSGSGTETEVSIAEGSNRVAVLAAMVEPGKLVTTHLLTLAATLVGDESPGAYYWMLQGILYFDPKGLPVADESSSNPEGEPGG